MIAMKIADTINRWFDETKEILTKQAEQQDKVHALCLAVMESGKDYCQAILLLLNHEHYMPAKALLRCLFDKARMDGKSVSRQEER